MRITPLGASWVCRVQVSGHGKSCASWRKMAMLGICSSCRWLGFKPWTRQTNGPIFSFRVSRRASIVNLTNHEGIHGAPFTSWDGVEGEGQRGYCYHGSNLFAIWHRPYLAAFEQMLSTQARAIVDELPDGDLKKKWSELARRQRLPYWDWAIDPPNQEEGSMPMSLRRESVTITYPNGTQEQRPNPLYSFAFHPLVPEDFAGFPVRPTCYLFNPTG
jgi:hypothetical protein